MVLSCRDLARLGLVMINGGVWKGQQIIPKAWVKECTTLRWTAGDMVSRKGQTGYAYMWWKPSEGRKDPEWAESFLAYGKWGQFILGLPAIDTVIVHQRAVTDEFNVAFNLGLTTATPAGCEFTDNDFLAIADAILAARI
jgi:CubicO group peptidase (beta-lactamase class C family)